MVSELPLIVEDAIFRRNIDRHLHAVDMPSWDCLEDTLVALVRSEAGKPSRCAVFDGNGNHQYDIPVPSGVTHVRISPTAVYLSSGVFSSTSGQLFRIDRKTRELQSYPFVNGMYTFEVDYRDIIWFLHGGFFEDASCIGVDGGAEKKLGRLSLEQLPGLMTVKGDQLVRLVEEAQAPSFYRFSRMTRTIDGHAVVYDPKRHILYNAQSHDVLAIDHGAESYNDVICLSDWVVLLKTTHIPHDESVFACFTVYEREEGWHTYAANSAAVLYTDRLHDTFFGDVRVMRDNVFVAYHQHRLTKYDVNEQQALSGFSRRAPALLRASK